MEIPQLLYADDTLVFCDAKLSNYSGVGWCSGCDARILPTTNLRLPLGAQTRCMHICNGVINKCDKRLTRWKAQYLSLGDRVIMISNVLRTYIM